jgi:hypothetical protein
MRQVQDVASAFEDAIDDAKEQERRDRKNNLYGPDKGEPR